MLKIIQKIYKNESELGPLNQLTSDLGLANTVKFDIVFKIKNKINVTEYIVKLLNYFGD